MRFCKAEFSLIADRFAPRPREECQTSSNLFTYFGCETEARQISLFGGQSQAGFLIWNSTLHKHMKNSLELISYPSIFSPSLKV